jgi:hypothetical protein
VMTKRSKRGLGQPKGVKAHRVRKIDWDPIRGLHQGQRS